MGELPNSPDWTCTSELYSFHGIQENQKTEPHPTLQNLRRQGDFICFWGAFKGRQQWVWMRFSYFGPFCRFHYRQGGGTPCFWAHFSDRACGDFLIDILGIM